MTNYFNVPDQRPRDKDVKYQTEASSPGSPHLVSRVFHVPLILAKPKVATCFGHVQVDNILLPDNGLSVGNDLPTCRWQGQSRFQDTIQVVRAPAHLNFRDATDVDFKLWWKVGNNCERSNVSFRAAGFVRRADAEGGVRKLAQVQASTQQRR